MRGNCVAILLLLQRALDNSIGSWGLRITENKHLVKVSFVFNGITQ